MCPLFSLAHHRQRGARRIHDTEQTRLHHIAKLLGCHLLKWSKVSIACIVHQYIQPAILVQSDLHGGLRRLFLTNIQLYRRDALPVLLYERVQLLHAPGPRDDTVFCR